MAESIKFGRYQCVRTNSGGEVMMEFTAVGVGLLLTLIGVAIAGLVHLATLSIVGRALGNSYTTTGGRARKGPEINANI